VRSGSPGQRPVGRHAVAPCLCLPVQIIEAVERACGKEGVAHVSYRPFDAALFIAARNRDRPRFVEVMRGDLVQI